MSLTHADRQQLEAWWHALLRRPGVLPAGLSPVQVRLVRAVSRGCLPDAGEVFVKSMGFPRGKDRLRYALRRLPAVHEGMMLRRCREHSVPVPEVLWVRGARRLLVPRASMLVTAALPTVAAPPDPVQVVGVVARLIEAGVFHRDLNTGNFLALRDGLVAVIDFQSARWHPAGVSRRDRRAMIVKLLADLLHHGEATAPCEQALVAAGLCGGDDFPGIRADASAVNRGFLVGRVRRCLQESTLFSVRRGLLGTHYQRRAMPPGGDWVEGGAEMFRYWMGDRGLEVLDAAEPVLGALYRPAPWATGRHRAYLPVGGRSALARASARLLAGHDRYLELVRTPPDA